MKKSENIEDKKKPLILLKSMMTSKRIESIENRLAPIIFSIILILIWQFVVGRGYVESFTLPAPVSIIIALKNILPECKRISVSVFLQDHRVKSTDNGA